MMANKSHNYAPQDKSHSGVMCATIAPLRTHQFCSVRLVNNMNNSFSAIACSKVETKPKDAVRQVIGIRYEFAVQLCGKHYAFPPTRSFMFPPKSSSVPFYEDGQFWNCGLGKDLFQHEKPQLMGSSSPLRSASWIRFDLPAGFG